MKNYKGSEDILEKLKYICTQPCIDLTWEIAMDVLHQSLDEIEKLRKEIKHD